MNRNFKKVAMVVVGVVGFSGVASADEYVLSYSEKELGTYNGVQAVHERIVKAAKQYCPTYSQIRNHRDVQSCVDGVVEDLVSKVNHPRMSAFHDGQGWQIAEGTDVTNRDRS